MTEQADIDGVVFSAENNGFCVVTNLWVLWQGPDVRGADRLLPGTPGVKAYPRRATVSRRVLELYVLGETTMTGTPHSDQRIGLEDNIDFIRANVSDPTGVGDGTRTLTLTMPSGAERTAAVHVEAFEFAGLGSTSVRGTLDLSILDGALAETGS